MRKNTARHWLHATLDLLPVILIPVFMIYSHRHTIDSYSVTRQERENQPYNFYQSVKNGLPNGTTNDWIADQPQRIEVQTLDSKTYLWFDLYDANSSWLATEITLDILAGDNVFYFSFDLRCTDDIGVSTINIATDNLDYEEDFNVTIQEQHIVFYETYTFSGSFSTEPYLNFYFENEAEYYLRNVQAFNLTQIFGSGNEPTKEQFESMLTQDYYNYGNNYVDNYVTISKTYNDTDIMSQFTYNLYNSVDKYFNMNNVFGMNNVYSWFETNIFHGTAPLYIYIVWNIILYEFVMDLLFLLYALFMWFVDVTKRLVEKPLDSIK